MDIFHFAMKLFVCIKRYTNSDILNIKIYICQAVKCFCLSQSMTAVNCRMFLLWESKTYRTCSWTNRDRCCCTAWSNSDTETTWPVGWRKEKYFNTKSLLWPYITCLKIKYNCLFYSPHISRERGVAPW